MIRFGGLNAESQRDLVWKDEWKDVGATAAALRISIATTTAAAERPTVATMTTSGDIMQEADGDDSQSTCVAKLDKPRGSAIVHNGGCVQVHGRLAS
jgi:hypothetical protein